MKRVNAEADADPETIRISVDTKATINLGPYSRGGRSRGLKAIKASDHDMMPKEKLVPGGILETANGKSFLFFTTSHKTSDFVVDGLDRWWTGNRERLAPGNGSWSTGTMARSAADTGVNSSSVWLNLLTAKSWKSV